MTATTLILLAAGWILIGLAVGLLIGRIIAGGDQFEQSAARLVQMRRDADQRSGIEILGWDPENR